MCLKVSHLLNIKTYSLPGCKSYQEAPCPSHPTILPRGPYITPEVYL